MHSEVVARIARNATDAKDTEMPIEGLKTPHGRQWVSKAF
jgi:hypothetical protein